MGALVEMDLATGCHSHSHRFDCSHRRTFYQLRPVLMYDKVIEIRYF